MKQKEASARIKINHMLEDAGWRFFDDEHGPANVCLEPHVKISRADLNGLGENFDKVKNGFVDFLLLDDQGRPYIVLEAKAEHIDPLVGKEQAREYAKALYLQYVILSNGNQHYFWNIYKGNPQLITSFPSCESLRESKAMNADPSKLYNEEIGPDYIARIRDPRYMEAPEYINPETRQQFLNEHGLRFLRPYQVNALKALQEAVRHGGQRFLFEMATGTGKTLTAAAVARLFLRTGNANRVLFLVDRIELENQAKKNFQNYLSPDYHTVLFKEHMDDWRKAEVVVSTVQTLLSNQKYKRFFKPTDFSLLIADECHRSISGNSRAVFEYFLGYKLGLTATPKDYIKNIDPTKLQATDPRAWERRQLLDSYRTFGCESGEPTYRYSLLDGVRDGYLINPTVADARTDVTTKLLAEEGYAIATQKEEEEVYFARDFEKTFFSEETNKMFVKTFMDHALRDPISGEIGKGIIFCVSRKHAAKVTQLLNIYADQMFPGGYCSDFALQITSDVMNAQTYTTNFQNNNLGGTTAFGQGYASSKTRVCVTVGMMTTGYDCEDLLNIGLMRPVFSPADFIQIKGRGTRKHDFVLKEGRETVCRIPKETFKLFDFFGNCEYFEEKFQYDEVLELPRMRSASGVPGTPSAAPEGYESFAPDPLKTLVETRIGAEGMKIDRMYFDRFEEKVREDPVAKEQYAQGNYPAVIRYIDDHIMNQPQEYYTWDKLRRSIGSDRRVTAREILDKIFGALSGFKSKKELVEDEFEGYVLTNDIPPEKYQDVKVFFAAYVTDKDVRRAIEDRKFQLLGTDIGSYTMADLKRLGLDGMQSVVDYVADNVNLSRFL